MIIIILVIISAFLIYNTPKTTEEIEGYWEDLDDPGRIWKFENGKIYTFVDGIQGNTGTYEWFGDKKIKITFGIFYENYTADLNSTILKLTVLSDYIDPWKQPGVYEYSRVSGTESEINELNNFGILSPEDVINDTEKYLGKTITVVGYFNFTSETVTSTLINSSYNLNVNLSIHYSILGIGVKYYFTGVLRDYYETPLIDDVIFEIEEV